MSGANSPGSPTTPEERSFFTQFFSAGTSVLPNFPASVAVTSRKGTQTSPRARKLLTSFAANANSGEGTLASRFISAAKC
jgi:hypothetical protein